MDIDSPQRNINASMHNPKNKQSEVFVGSLGSDAVNPNSVPPMQKHLEEANVKAFSGAKSFANAAKGKDKGPGVHFGEESGALSRTICRLKEELTTGRPVPATDMCNVVFWDIKGLPVTEDELKEAVLETGAIGWVHRKSAGWIEVAYSTIEDRDQAAGKQIFLPRNHVVQPVLPRKYSAQQIYICLANILILPEKQLREGITEYWETFGLVGELEPHYYEETSALSR
jgi:hypothetical protein